MIADGDFDDLVQAWLADGPTQLSDWVLDETLVRVRSSRPRRIGAQWGFARAPSRLSIGAGVVGLVVLVVLGFALLRPSDLPVAKPPSMPTAPVPSPSNSHAPSPVPTDAAPSPSQPAFTARATPLLVLPRGVLPPGAYTSVMMRPSVRFTTPGGLVMRDETVQDVWLSLGYEPNAPEFEVLRGDEPHALDRIAGDPSITASPPVAITVGGRPARAIDVSLSADVTDGVLVAALTEVQALFYLMPGSRGRVIEVTIGSDELLIFYQAPASRFAEFALLAEEILVSLTFPE